MCVQAPEGMNVFPDHSFDVVHVSQMILSVSDATPGSERERCSRPKVPNFAGVLQQCHRVLRRGGIILVHEPRFHIHSAWEGFEAADLSPGLTKVVYLSSLLL
jgi:SAM-dependent methyltransferase